MLYQGETRKFLLALRSLRTNSNVMKSKEVEVPNFLFTPGSVAIAVSG